MSNNIMSNSERYSRFLKCLSLLYKTLGWISFEFMTGKCFNTTLWLFGWPFLYYHLICLFIITKNYESRCLQLLAKITRDSLGCSFFSFEVSWSSAFLRTSPQATLSGNEKESGHRICRLGEDSASPSISGWQADRQEEWRTTGERGREQYNRLPAD